MTYELGTENADALGNDVNRFMPFCLWLDPEIANCCA